MARDAGVSVRWKLTLSYAGFLAVGGALLLGAVWVFLLRHVPDGVISTSAGFVPNRSDLVRVFTPAAILVMISLAAIGLLGGWFVAGRMLAPLTRLTEATRIAASGTLSHRVGLEGRADEFRELADAFDAMLARLEAHVTEQQRFAANASHELRTPLAITQALLDVARADPGRDLSEDLARLQATNARAVALTEALLLLSRADNAVIGDQTVDLSLLAEEAAETLLPLAEGRDVTIAVTGSVAFTTGEPTLLLQMVTNLIHNAIVHNLPVGARIDVSTNQEGERAVLVVENTGADLIPQQVATFTEPFERGNRRVRDGDHVGAGLGLAIVDRIVHAHRGTLTLTPRADGGLRVRVALPAGSRP